MRNVEKKMRYEKYLEFFQLSWRSNISRFSLNQIIEMHGFRKLHQECKALIQECVEWIELTEPTRSTLEESISSCAFVAADEIGADLEALGWQECLLVRSVQTLKSEAEQEYIIANEDLPLIPCGATSADEAAPRRRRRRRRRRGRRAPPAEFVIVGKRPRSKRKRVSVNALIAGGAGCGGGRSSASSSSVVIDEEDFVPPPPPYPRQARPPSPSSPPPLSQTPMAPSPPRVPSACFDPDSLILF